MKLKILIQDLVDTKKIDVEQPRFKIYTNLMLKHNKGKGKGIDYSIVNHVYDETIIAFLEEVVSIVTIKGPSVKCGITT
jgi:1-deoxy-D-xylulose 5-phosphate reductoisomerase